MEMTTSDFYPATLSTSIEDSVHERLGVECSPTRLDVVGQTSTSTLEDVLRAKIHPNDLIPSPSPQEIRLKVPTVAMGVPRGLLC